MQYYAIRYSLDHIGFVEWGRILLFPLDERQVFCQQNSPMSDGQVHNNKQLIVVTTTLGQPPSRQLCKLTNQPFTHTQRRRYHSKRGNSSIPRLIPDPQSAPCLSNTKCNMCVGLDGWLKNGYAWGKLWQRNGWNNSVLKSNEHLLLDSDRP